MSILYNLDGSVELQGDADPSRKQHVPGPKNSSAQLKAVKDFHALEQEPTDG